MAGRGHASWGPQGPAALQRPLPLQPRPLPQPNRGETCTHRLTVPSRGAILSWRPWGSRGSLWPGNRLCTGALHHWACGTLRGVEGTGWGHTSLPAHPPPCPPASWAGLSTTQGHAGRTHTGEAGGADTSGPAPVSPTPAHMLHMLWLELPQPHPLCQSQGEGGPRRRALAQSFVGSPGTRGPGDSAPHDSGSRRWPHLFHAVSRAPDTLIQGGDCI